MIHFVVATSVCLLSSSKYASACPGRMEATGYLPLQFFFGNPTAPHSLAGNWYLIGRSLVPSYSNFPTSILSITNFSSRSQFLRPCLLPSITLSRDGPNGICVTNQPHIELVLESKESITSPVQNDNKNTANANMVKHPLQKTVATTIFGCES